MEHFEEQNIIDLTLNDDMVGINENALSEERANCRDVYARLKSIMDRAKADMPYPDVEPYSVAYDYDEIVNLMFYKKAIKGIIIFLMKQINIILMMHYMMQCCKSRAGYNIPCS